MAYINCTINGVPYGKAKRRGDIEAAERWTPRIKEQINHLARIKEACVMKVTFLLPPKMFPSDYPYGTDLDNLLKRFLDALNETIFSEAPGKDSCVVSMTVMKTRVALPAEAGVHFELLPIELR